MALADLLHVAEVGRVAGVVDRRAAADAQHEARRRPAVDHRRRAGRGLRHAQAARVHGGHHGDRDLAVGDGDLAAHVHQRVEAHPLAREAEHCGHVRAELEARHEPRAGAARERHRVAHVIEMAVRHQDVVEALHGGEGIATVARRGVARVAQPRVDHQHVAAGRDDLEGGMPVPGDARLAGRLRRLGRARRSEGRQGQHQPEGRRGESPAHCFSPPSACSSWRRAPSGPPCPPSVPGRAS